MSPSGRRDCITLRGARHSRYRALRCDAQEPMGAANLVRAGRSHHALGAAHRGGGWGRVPQPRAEERGAGLDGSLRVADRASRIQESQGSPPHPGKDHHPIPARLASGGLAAVAASGDESGAASAASDRKR